MLIFYGCLILFILLAAAVTRVLGNAEHVPVAAGYVAGRIALRKVPRTGTLHLVVCVADHYEPGGRNPGYEREAAECARGLIVTRNLPTGSGMRTAFLRGTRSSSRGGIPPRAS